MEAQLIKLGRLTILTELARKERAGTISFLRRWAFDKGIEGSEILKKEQDSMDLADWETYEALRKSATEAIHKYNVLQKRTRALSRVLAAKERDNAPT